MTMPELANGLVKLREKPVDRTCIRPISLPPGSRCRTVMAASKMCQLRLVLPGAERLICDLACLCYSGHAIWGVWGWQGDILPVGRAGAGETTVPAVTAAATLR